MTFFEPPSRDTSWKTSDDPFSRLRREYHRKRVLTASVVAGLAVATLVGVVAVTGPDRLLTSAQHLLQPEPAADLVAIADKAFLTDVGRATLYAARPRVADLDEIARACDSGEDEAPPMGCYNSLSGITLYQPADPRVADTAVTTLAHELLHAAYEGLGTGEISEIHEMLHVEIARVSLDDPVHQQIQASIGAHGENRETELFAYLGSQIMPDGGFAPELEAVYARFFTDRAALVAVHRQVTGAVEATLAEAVAARDALAAAEAANSAERAQLDVDIAAYEAARTVYNADADHYNAIPESERGQWTATWTQADGTTFSGLLGEVLAQRLAALDAERASHATRRSELEAAEAEAQTRRVEVEAQLADLTVLLEAMYPQ